MRWASRTYSSLWSIEDCSGSAKHKMMGHMLLTEEDHAWSLYLQVEIKSRLK